MLVERKAFEGFSGASEGQRTVLGLVRMESGNKCLSTGPQFVHLILNVRVIYKRKLNNKTSFNQKLNSSIDSNFWLLLIHPKQLFVFVTHNFLRQNFLFVCTVFISLALSVRGQVRKLVKFTKVKWNRSSNLQFTSVCNGVLRFQAFLIKKIAVAATILRISRDTCGWSFSFDTFYI